MTATSLRRVVSTAPVIATAEPVLGPKEKAALLAVIDSGWITMGERVRAFEAAFAQMHGADDAVAVSSCTAALHLALHAFGIGPGDEVLVPALTFVATANSVLYVGAEPVFVDIASPDRPLLSLEDAAAKCTARTRAIMLVHYAGYVVDAPAWRRFADQRGLVLIEDAAHCAGLDAAGAVGDAAAFSFYGNKNMTTAEGGIILTRKPELRENLRRLRSHGLTSGTFERHRAASPGYDVVALGFNYRMDEFRAAIGLAQLERLELWNRRRAALTACYRAMLPARVPSIALPFAAGGVSSHHIMPVLLPPGCDRAGVIAELRDRGVQTTIHYPPVHRLSLYAERFAETRLPVAEDFADRELTLPLHPKLQTSDVERVVDALASVVPA